MVTQAKTSGIRMWLRRPEVHLVALLLVVRVALLVVGYVAMAPSDGTGDTGFSVDYLRDELDAFRYADADWYAGIAEDGYADREFSDDVKENWSFFPAFPMVWRAIWDVGPSPIASALLFNTAVFAAGIVALYRLVRRDVSEEVAFLAGTLLILSPASYFAFRPGPEAMFFAAVVGSLLAARNDRWVAAGGLAAVATLSRPQGILVLLPLAWVAWRQHRSDGRVRPAWSALLLAPAALLGFLLYMRDLTGNALAPFEIQRAWDSEARLPFTAVARWLGDPAVLGYYGFDLLLFSVVGSVGAIALLAWATWRRTLPVDYLLYGIPAVLVVVSRAHLVGAMRFLLPVFPVYVALAVLLVRRRLASQMVVSVFALLQGALFMAFVWQTPWAAN